jgi:hypothetical protein
VDEEVVLYDPEHGTLGITVTETQTGVVTIGDHTRVRRRCPTVDRGRPRLSEDFGESRLKALKHPLRDLLQAVATGP